MAKVRVGIIGGGVIGCSIGYHLSLFKDTEVVIFEQNTIGSGTTAKSAGTVCLIDDSVPNEWFQERLYGFRAFVNMEAEKPGCTGFHKTGTLVVCPDQKFVDYVTTAVAQTTDAGYSARFITDHNEIHKIVPDLKLDGILGAGYTPDDGYFDATAIAKTYADKARANGVEVLINTKVNAINTRGGRVTGVESTRGNYELDWVVNATGPWGRFVGRLVGLELPLWHTKAEVFIVKPTQPLGYDLPILKYPRFYTRPEKDAVFVCKSHVGLDLTNKKDAGIFDPDELPMTGGTEAYFWDFLTEQLMQYFPRLLESSLVNDWVGYRSVTKDFMPILGPSPVEGFLLANGPSGNGVIEAPIVGAATAQYIQYGTKPPIFERLKLERFAGEYSVQA